MKVLGSTLLYFLGLMSLGLMTAIPSIANSEMDIAVMTRFEQLALEIRRHRSDMLLQFHEERQTQLPEPKKGQEGLRVYLRWASDSNAIPKELKIYLRQMDGRQVSRVLGLPEDPFWQLKWYSLLLPRPTDRNFILYVEALYEVREFETPFQENRVLRKASGSIPILINGEKTLYVRMELESLSSVSRDRAGDAGLRLSSMSDLLLKENSL
jgi:hypothetical protein